MQKYSCNENFFKDDSEASFYWAGYIAADGCARIKETKYSQVPSLELNSADHDHIDKLVKILDFKIINNNYGDKKYAAPIYKSSKGYSKIDGHELTSSQLYLNSKIVFDDLREKFLVEPNKTKVHYFPNHLKGHPLLNHFMRGYFDGDGGFYLQKKKQCREQMSIRVCGTLDFLNEYKNVVESSSGFTSVSKPYMYHGQGALNYGGNSQIKKFGNYIYNNATIYMERKREQFLSMPEPEKKFFTVEDVKDLYLKYQSRTRVARELGCHASTLRYFAIKNDLLEFFKQHKKHQPLLKGRAKPTKDELISALLELKSITQVANKFNYSTDSIYSFIRKYEIEYDRIIYG